MPRFPGVSRSHFATIRRWCLCPIENEPPHLHRQFLMVIILSVGGFALAVGSWFLQGARPMVWGQNSRCKQQLDERERKIDKAKAEISQSDTRVQEFEKALVDKSSPYFAVSREKIEEEEGIKNKLSQQISDLQITSLAGAKVIPLLIAYVVIAFGVGRLVLIHGSKAILVPSKATLKDWSQPYWLLVLIPFIANMFTDLKASVWSVNKSWFSWDSFCICPGAWGFDSLITTFAVFMAVGYPASLLWCFSRKAYLPTKMSADAKDGAWGVGSYVLFLQTWATLAAFLLLIPPLLWIQFAAVAHQISAIYFLPLATLLGVVAIVDYRLIRNAVCIRLLYSEEMEKLGTTWSEIQSHNPPGDPTKNFLGEQWWSLPAIILSILGLLWIVVEWLGAGAPIVRFMSRSGP